MLYVLNGSWMGLPVETIPHEGMVRVGGCFCTSLAEFLEMVEAALTDGALRLEDPRWKFVSRLKEASFEEREDGIHLVLPDAA